ncbi:protein-disulfide reductase DsbD family protein [Variovorax sp. HJSM1_2]|uniref:protein-disulfide reductase DsbD family protein n=1 Tax=Variovorax sp. HJSM1_2 TaxID=3366263 RepID=UPI003BD64ABE
MRRLTSLKTFLLAILFAAACAAGISANAQNALKPSGSAASTLSTAHVQAELMAYAPDGISPGATVWVGLQLQHAPEWHTYWKNSGDSGLPTELQWTLPAGIQAGEIAWPLPRKIPIGTLANYGYEGTVLLPVPLEISSAFKPPLLGSEVEIRLKAAWLVCRKECIPEEGEFALKLPVRGSTALNSSGFLAAQAAQPQALPAGSSTAAVNGEQLEVRVTGLPKALRGQTLTLYPETPEVIHTAAEIQQDWQGAVWSARVPLSAHRSNSPEQMPMVLATVGTGDAARQGFRTVAEVTTSWPPVAAPAAITPALQAALAANAPPPSTLTPASGVTLAAALLGALLGGLILNLMPCVFPVLALKLVGFARHNQDRQALRLGGLAYAIGVVVSFLALGGVMLGLRAAGAQLGWGFQLQSPLMVAGLALLFTLIGLNLAGLLNVGNLLPSRVASVQLRHSGWNDFLSGILAVAIASPCTAPFMGASLGLAVGLPAAQALLIFATLGLGMALPYLLASFTPGMARWLPRPGLWMEQLRRFMAFPMLATVVWLVWVIGQQTGINGAATLLALLLGVSAVLWTFSLSGWARPLFATLSIASLALLAGAIGQNLVNTEPASSHVARADSLWQPWSREKVQQAHAQGRPVMVDFTAAWCVTCQYNKLTALSDASVLADLQAKQVMLLRADWTRRDPAITAALAELGRSGVPVYVLVKPGQAPVVLSELLTADALREAIATL